MILSIERVISNKINPNVVLNVPILKKYYMFVIIVLKKCFTLHLVYIVSIGIFTFIFVFIIITIACIFSILNLLLYE